MIEFPKPGELWTNTDAMFCWPEKLSNKNIIDHACRANTICLSLGYSEKQKTVCGKKMYLFLINEQILTVPTQYMINGMFVKCKLKENE